MMKRIFRSIALTAMLAVLLAVGLSALTIFGVYERELSGELRSEAGYLRHALSREADEAAFFEGFSSENRVTLIAADGEVLYDSEADASALDNHAARPEVAQALEQGWGESERYSNTLAEGTYYYAVRTDDGNVLRVADTRSSVLGVLLRTLPAALAVLAAAALLALELARLVSRRIVAPLNHLNLDEPLENEVYDELSPLLTRMDAQRREIERQIEALNRAQREMRAVTENMREGLILLDRKSCVLSMNESAARIFGVRAQERTGADMLSICRMPAVQRALSEAQLGRSADAVIARGGRQYQLLASPVLRGGEPAGAVLLLLDITERHAAELSRREFTANVSHELKTPLTSISGYAEIIRDGVAKQEDVKPFAARICEEAEHLLKLIEDILELSRLDERRGLGERGRVNLLEAARAAARRLDALAKEKGIELRVKGEPAAVSGHATLLGEMIYNLVDNAVKYTPEGGHVSLSVEQAGEGASVSVQDDGIGIPPEHQAHVFERFYRVDKSHSRETGGTGLGLSIVKHGAAIHGASVELTSEVGKGTRVRLNFPAWEGQEG